MFVYMYAILYCAKVTSASKKRKALTLMKHLLCNSQRKEISERCVCTQPPRTCRAQCDCVYVILGVCYCGGR